MNPLVIFFIVFACVFICALAGMVISSMLPEHHLSVDSRDVVKLSMGLVATMAALVLGLLTSSAKTSFDTATSEVQQSAANVILLDRALARYGAETKHIRNRLRKAIECRLHETWPEEGTAQGSFDATAMTGMSESIGEDFGRLTPQTDDQREYKAQAQKIGHDLMALRWLVFAQAVSPLPMPFLVVMVFWLCILFGSFGLMAPRNATVIASIFFCALAVSSATYLILELNHPFDGLIKASSAPLQYALSQLGR